MEREQKKFKCLQNFPNIIYYFTPYEFFTPVSISVFFSLKSEWEQVSSGFQESN